MVKLFFRGLVVVMGVAVIADLYRLYTSFCSPGMIQLTLSLSILILSLLVSRAIK